MAQVTSRYSYPDALERKIMDQQYYDIEARKQLERKLSHLDEKAKDTVLQMEAARQELYKIRTLNKGLQKKIDDEETEVKSLHTKVGSLKVKLGVANANLNTGNDEKEKLRAGLNEIQVEVARLEERLAAATSDLDRMRDPANPESNMSIRKHVVNDKKEIKRLKGEIENETQMLEIDKETVGTKDAKIKALEKELGKMKALLKECENERQEAQNEEELERKRKEELIHAYQNLKIDRQSYDKKLKELKIRLGISVANQNVSSTLETQIKKEDKSLAKQMAQLEKKLKDATGQLDVLKNQHKMSKTAMSINNYTRRNQMRRGSEGRVSLAQSGTGPVKFGKAVPTDQSKSVASSTTKGSMPSIPEKLRASEGAKEKQNGGKAKQASPGQQNPKPAGGSNGVTSQTSQKKPTEPNQNDGSPQRSIATRSTASTEKGSPSQLVPPPKPKLQKTTPR